VKAARRARKKDVEESEIVQDLHLMNPEALDDFLKDASISHVKNG
jgi:hypothetical protein